AAMPPPGAGLHPDPRAFLPEELHQHAARVARVDERLAPLRALADAGAFAEDGDLLCLARGEGLREVADLERHVVHRLAAGVEELRDERVVAGGFDRLEAKLTALGLDHAGTEPALACALGRFPHGARAEDALVPLA